jgi:hypothetical protein
LIITVTVKSTDRHFALYKVVTLPERISSNRFVCCLIDYPYFGIHNSQLDCLLLTEEQYSHCTSGNIVISPIYTANYNARTLSCASSLYFQNSNNYRLCNRELPLHQQTPLPQKHGAHWVYYFPEERTVTVHSSEPTGQLTRTVSLHGPGLLHNVTSYHISSCELRSLPGVRGSTQTELDSSNFYVPSRIANITDHEAQRLEEIVPPDIKKLDYVSSHVLTQKQSYDVDTLFQPHRNTKQHERQLQWYTTLSTSTNVAMSWTLQFPYIHSLPETKMLHFPHFL